MKEQRLKLFETMAQKEGQLEGALALELIEEVRKLKDALSGSAVISSHAGARIRELEEENKQLRVALREIHNLLVKDSFEYDDECIEIAKKALKR